MPKQVECSEFDVLIEILGRRPEGASIDDIARASAIDLPRRTLQRRLATLVKDGRLILEGRGRGSRYRISGSVFAGLEPVEFSLELSPGELTVDDLEVGIPLSSEGQSVKRMVRAPIQERRPAGYDRAFLDCYRPNETFYLSAEVRRRLRDLGRSPDEERPAGTYARKIHHRLLIDLSWNSCAVRQSLGEPEPFRLRYRELVAGCVRDIVTKMMDKKTATAWLRRRASQVLPAADGRRLVDVVETEAMSLHEGNIARFKLSPPEFEAWKKIWR